MVRLALELFCVGIFRSSAHATESNNEVVNKIKEASIYKLAEAITKQQYVLDVCFRQRPRTH